MEIDGRIILDLPMQTGTSKAGKPWKKKEWVLETFGSYPRKVKFHIFGDRADTIRFELGKDYTVSFDLESREFNGRWYTDVSVYAARDYVNPTNLTPPPTYGNEPTMGYGAPQGGFQQSSAPAFNAPQQPTFTAPPANSEEDLPF